MYEKYANKVQETNEKLHELSSQNKPISDIQDDLDFYREKKRWYREKIDQMEKSQ